MKEIIFKFAESLEECASCNRLLEDLIKFEGKFDPSINTSFVIDELYERTLNKDDVCIAIAKNEDVIIGYIMAYKAKSNPANKRNIITIMNVFVKNEFQHMGVGTRLFDKVEKWGNSLCENPMFELDCYIENVIALRFYEKLGYTQIRVKLRKN